MQTKFIEKALKNIFIDVFRSELKDTQNSPIDNALYSTIDVILEDSQQERVYFALSRETLQKLLTIYMFEENNSEDELIDFSKEFANLIVGRAKVFAQSKNQGFDISTPKIIDKVDDVSFKKQFYYNYDGHTFMYGY